MVYSPSMYLVAAAVATMALQMEQTVASSLFYEPVTITNTSTTLSCSFPGFSAEIDEEDAAYELYEDPTLPDITTISTAPVTHPDLLTKHNGVPPTDPIFTKVGTKVLSFESPVGSSHDAYVAPDFVFTAPVSKPKKKQGITTLLPPPSNSNTNPALDGVQKKPGAKDCATGWPETSVPDSLQGSAVLPTIGQNLSVSTTVEPPQRRLENMRSIDLERLEAYFKVKMELILANLPTVGVVIDIPWPGPYWPCHQDGINVVWSDGEPSATEKYALAFGHDVEELMNRVSRRNGIDKYYKNKKCNATEDCASLNDGSDCGIRTNYTSGFCIQTWFGLCHAWSPASINEKEPRCAVTYNGVTFQPLDIKALITYIYDESSLSTVFTGSRYYGSSNQTDQYGRHVDPVFRDVNAGFFHITLANLIGRLNVSFVVDVSADREVWNQPVRGFKVYEQTAMTPEEAAQTFYGLEKYPWNAAAKSIVYMKTRLSWITEAYENGGLVESGAVNRHTSGSFYYYLLELDEKGAIIGGEWLYDSTSDHIDFIWLVTNKPSNETLTPTGLSYAEVSLLLEMSASCTSP